MSDPESLESGVHLQESSASDVPALPASQKRRREEDTPPLSKRAVKRKKQKKRVDEEDENLDLEAGINTAIGRMDNRLIADLVAQRTKRFDKDLSIVELEDRYLPDRAIHDTSNGPTKHDLQNLPDFLESFVANEKGVSKMASAPKRPGHPHTLVIAGAGLRAADITRALRRFETKEAKVAKLFAKHIKLKEAVETVKKTRMSIGIGTPQRLIDLLENGMWPVWLNLVIQMSCALVASY